MDTDQLKNFIVLAQMGNSRLGGTAPQHRGALPP